MKFGQGGQSCPGRCIFMAAQAVSVNGSQNQVYEDYLREIDNERDANEIYEFR